jgi:dihydroflavonol-4-reductase
MFGPFDALIGSGIFLLSIYRRQMPAVLAGGISALDVRDAVEGHLLAMEKGRTGGRYILTGPPGTHLRFPALAGVIAEVLRERFPDLRIRRQFAVIPVRAALLAAAISELSTRRSGRPVLLSRGVVRAGSQALFYHHEAAARDLGYCPRRPFRQAVEDMAEYYSLLGLFTER